MRNKTTPVIGLEYISESGWTGGGIYLRNLVYCLATLPEIERPDIRLLGADPGDPAVQLLNALPFVNGPTLGKPPGVYARLWRRIQRRYLGRLIGTEPEADGVQAVYPGFGPRLPGAAHIHWIPDLQHVRLPEMFTAEERKARNVSMSRVAASDGILVLSSHCAERDFMETFPDARIGIRVWPFCSVITEHEQGGDEPHRKFGLPEKYLYLPNQFWKHKNHATVFKALGRLKDRGIRIPLACTGLESDPRNPHHIDELKALIRSLGLTGSVRMLGLVSRPDQIEILRHAAAVVQPSLFEGRSTVVEDTKIIGRPILLSDIPVHREQMAEEPEQPYTFFSPDDVEALATLIADEWPALTSGPNLASEAAAARRAKRYQLQAGRAFLAIVNEAIGIERAQSNAHGA